MINFSVGKKEKNVLGFSLLKRGSIICGLALELNTIIHSVFRFRPWKLGNWAIVMKDASVLLEIDSLAKTNLRGFRITLSVILKHRGYETFLPVFCTVMQLSNSLFFLFTHHSAFHQNTVFENQRKVSSNMASKARYVYILSGQKFIKNAKNSQHWRFFKNLKLAGVTRQVTFNRTKNYGKCQNWKIQMRHFEWFLNTVKSAFHQ